MNSLMSCVCVGGWQAVAVGSVERKTLLFAGYVALAVTQTLLTITLNLQVGEFCYRVTILHLKMKCVSES